MLKPYQVYLIQHWRLTGPVSTQVPYMRPVLWSKFKPPIQLNVCLCVSVLPLSAAGWPSAGWKPESAAPPGGCSETLQAAGGQGSLEDKGQFLNTKITNTRKKIADLNENVTLRWFVLSGLTWVHWLSEHGGPAGGAVSAAEGGSGSERTADGK